MKQIAIALSLTSTAAFAMADMATGQSASTGPVAEIVTFRLVDGANEEAFVEAAGGMKPFLDSTGAVLARRLSKSADGTWTDHITWTNLDAALSAAEHMMAQPEAIPFMSLIDESSVRMRHDPILFQSE